MANYEVIVSRTIVFNYRSIVIADNHSDAEEKGREEAEKHTNGDNLPNSNWDIGKESQITEIILCVQNTPQDAK